MKKIAVVGGGIAGLTAAYLLRDRYDVQVFEAAPIVGGHTLTVTVNDGRRDLAIDMGFIVFNDRTYPRFIQLLDELGVASEASEMSFSVRCETTGLEYNGSSLNQMFAQRSNLLRPSFYRMLLEILRFHKIAPTLLDGDAQPTLGAFLDQHGFRGPVVDHYLVPMTAAIWSTGPGRMLDFPARSLVEFLVNHGMITVRDRPQWRVVTGGSQRYVDVLCARLGARIRTDSPVERIRRLEGDAGVVGGVEMTVHGANERYDDVVIATHSDQALAMLDDATDTERAILGAIPYQDNEVVLHTDASVLPRRRRAWASWNYHLSAQDAPGDPLRMTYYMNRLQNLTSPRNYCVTLNRSDEIAPDTVLERRTMAHPLFTSAGRNAQGRWAEISGPRRTHYCGAYWSYGFHEDGVKSAVRVAQALGVDW